MLEFPVTEKHVIKCMPYTSVRCMPYRRAEEIGLRWWSAKVVKDGEKMKIMKKYQLLYFQLENHGLVYIVR